MKGLALSFVSLVAVMLLSGCVASSQLYVGKIVAEDDIVTLQNGKQRDILWETFDVVFTFDYEISDDILQVAGKGRLGDHYQAIYTHLGHFDAYLFQVDRDGYVLDTVRLPTLMMSRPDDDFTFKKELKRVPGTVGMSFGYSGEVYEREKSEPLFRQLFNQIHFRKLP